MPYKDPNKKRAYDRDYQKRKASAASVSDPRHPFCVVTKDGKVVHQDILDQYAVKAGGEESRQMPIDRFGDIYSKDRLVQPLYNPETLAQVAEINPYHAKCCQVKARDTAGMGIEMKPLIDNPSEAQRDLLQRFLDAQMNLTDEFYRHQYDVEVTSYGALELVREGHKAETPIAFMYHVPAHTLRMHQDGIKVAQVRANKKRWFKLAGSDYDVDWETGRVDALGSMSPERRATEVLWNSLYSQRSDYYGIADIIPALGAIHGDTARRDYNLNFFDNFGIPAYAVFITGDYDPGPVDEDTGRTELEESIREHFRELSANPHSTLILTIPSREGGASDVRVTFQPLAIDVKDASFRLYRKDNRDEVIIAHGVPPYRIGVAETGALGGSTAAESTKIYKDSVINPRQETLENLINHHIVREGLKVTDWSLKFAELDDEDQERSIDMVIKLFDMGAMRIRDVIQLYGAKFGLEDDPSDEILDLRFVGGQPINSDPDGMDMAMAAFMSMEDKLLKVAMKDERSAQDGPRLAIRAQNTKGHKAG